MFENCMKQKFQKTSKTPFENKLKKCCYKIIKLCDEKLQSMDYMARKINSQALQLITPFSDRAQIYFSYLARCFSVFSDKKIYASY